MRSLLFVPAHDARKLAKGLDSGADALILDLEDSVPDAEKVAARASCAAFLAQNAGRMPLFVRVNALATGLLLDDLAAVVAAGPYGIMLPKSTRGRDVAEVGHYLSALEARERREVGAIRILPIATENAESLFHLGSYAADAGPRLCGMMWGGEDLATDLGASANRVDGAYLPPYVLARSLLLAGATAAGVPAVDSVYTDFRDDAGHRAECADAVRLGFSAKAAIHPAQVAAINDAFTPKPEALAHARAIIDAFARQPTAGAINIDGKMVDRPHLRAAERLVARTGGAKA